MPSRKPRRSARRAAAALVGLSAGLAVLAGLEAAARRADPKWRVLNVDDPPFASFTGAKRQFADDAFAAASRRLVFVGGSTTAGYPFPLAGIAEWTRAELGRCGESGFSVENRGQGSYGSRRELIVLQEALERPADAVVFYPGHNEDLEARLVRSLPPWQLRGPLPWLYRRSALLTKWTRVVMRRARRPAGLLNVGGVFGYPLNYGSAPDPDETARGFARRLADMARLTRSRGARPLICAAPVDPHFRPPFPAGCPPVRRARRALEAGRPAEALRDLDEAPRSCRSQSLPQWIEGTALEALGETKRGRAALLAYADGAGPSPEGFRGIERRVAADEGAALVDVEGRFSAGARDGLPASRYFTDSHHLSQEGDRAAAREIVAALARAGLVSPACPAPWPKTSRPSGPFGQYLSDMRETLELRPRYLAVPAMTLANVNGFYFGDSEDPWFRVRALTWAKEALRIDPAQILPHLRRDTPVVDAIVREAYAAVISTASSSAAPAAAAHNP